MSRYRTFCAIATVILTAACGDGDANGDQARAERAETAAADPAAVQHATAYASGSGRLTPEELEAGRMDSTWRRYVESSPGRSDRANSPDRAGQPQGPPADSQSWDQISPETVNAQASGFPIYGDVEGPSVARIQILLDMNRFSPGVIDGRWGKNTEKAIYWFQSARGMDATGEVDRATMEALEGGASGEVVTTRTLTQASVAGPFRAVPEDIYQQAEQSCMCYESQREQLAEAFHTTPELLEQLNPDVDLNAVSAGESVAVPAVGPFHVDELPDGQYTGGGEVARILISDGGSYLHALNAAGDILYHFPSTLGADYSPSPEGQFTVQSITFDPTWHYQPEILAGVDDSDEDAVIPAGPNNAVGVVWMALSEPHYGIHGTSAPETIGYATSNGCVRLTNWDAAFLGQRISPDTPVEFRDVRGRG